MARKRRKYEDDAHPADGHMRTMRYKDLQKECIIRGMPFHEVVANGIPQLSYYFREHFFENVDHTLLDKYDEWVESQITDKNLIHPSLRLGYVGEEKEDGTVTKRRVKTIGRKVKKKRERTKDNVFKGTKKALAFQLQGEGLSKAEVIKAVINNFPDANEKSIGIWFNKAKKLRDNGCSVINA